MPCTRRALSLCLAGLLALAPACRSADRAHPANGARGATTDGLSAADRSAIESTLRELYRAFAFEAGGHPDWETMRGLFVEGASFVSPIADGGEARAHGVDAFFGEFAAYVASDPVVRTGLFERIVRIDARGLGHIAHAWVTFEGFVPRESTARTRGVDSVQLVRDGGRWKVCSFATQYESDAHPLPATYRSEAP